eukprot:179941-Amphidinium_carterae.1
MFPIVEGIQDLMIKNTFIECPEEEDEEQRVDVRKVMSSSFASQEFYSNPQLPDQKEQNTQVTQNTNKRRSFEFPIILAMSGTFITPSRFGNFSVREKDRPTQDFEGVGNHQQ